MAIGNNINITNSRQIRVNNLPAVSNQLNINNTVTKPKTKRGTKLNKFIETIYKPNNNNNNNNNRTDKKSNSRSNNYGNNNRSSKSNNRSSQNRSRRQ
jgi:hypothetical protein